MNAHYQTTPENKRWFVDDPSVTCVCLYEQKHLIGVALITAEGELPDDLAQQVMNGERRPRGHLLPQSLLAHEGLTGAGQFKYWRISRIAIAPHKQNQGYGSKLLALVEQEADKRSVDFVATSFAATPAVTHFWHKNTYLAVRLGTSKDQASGAYSLMMLKALTPNSERCLSEWSVQFSKNWLTTLPLRLQQLSTELIIEISHACEMGENSHITTLSAKDESDLTYFAQHNRPYSSIRSALLKLALHLLRCKKLSTDTPDSLILLGCALNILNEGDAHSLGFKGKKAFYPYLKKSVLRHLNSL